jgi:hypothetical protein
MATLLKSQGALDPASREFYQRVMGLLAERQLDYLVGGAYSFARYTGIERHTKDFDIFVRPADAPRILASMEEAGYETELTFPHWLGKVRSGDNFIDVIFSSGNGVARVDDVWFTHAVPETVLEMPVLLCPPEETIWSKGFVMERERYDGADVAHLLRATASTLNWQRLLARFNSHWRVLLSHLILFGFAYPGERNLIPAWVLEQLLDLARQELRANHAPQELCQGTLFSRAQYLVDIEHWGYRDARLAPGGGMSQRDIDGWTAAIDSEPATEAAPPSLGQCPSE